MGWFDKKDHKETRQHLRGEAYQDHIEDVAYTLTHLTETFGLTCARGDCGDVIITPHYGQWGDKYCSDWCRYMSEGGDL